MINTEQKIQSILKKVAMFDPAGKDIADLERLLREEPETLHAFDDDGALLVPVSMFRPSGTRRALQRKRKRQRQRRR